ncbi:MAG: NeuD/PglB/VioB family sugar acetyltransferase [Planctomycetes bacterium]|nr:NeuD/PglB/VioB family sugar acetyltransferase [Planctomycetota bacterium]
METIILGAGGHGRVVLDILLAGDQYKPVAFIDNNPSLHGRRVDGLPVLGDVSQLLDLRKRNIRKAIVAIGDNGARRGAGVVLERAGFDVISAIHPSARLAGSASIGKGAVVAAGALVCAHAQIGDYVILNTGCIVDHESMIGTSAHICPGVKLAGHVTVESGAFVGISDGDSGSSHRIRRDCGRRGRGHTRCRSDDIRGWRTGAGDQEFAIGR